MAVVPKQIKEKAKTVKCTIYVLNSKSKIVTVLQGNETIVPVFLEGLSRGLAMLAKNLGLNVEVVKE